MGAPRLIGSLKQRRFAHSAIEDPISGRILVIGGNDLRYTEIIIEDLHDPYNIEFHSHLVQPQLYNYERYPFNSHGGILFLFIIFIKKCLKY